MNTRHTLTALLGATLLTFTSIGVAQHRSAHEGPSVAISTAVSVQRGCTTDCGLADEPTNAGIVACGWAMDDLAESVVVTDQLVSDCDYRVTGEACEEGELCALEQIRETGAFGR
jgi:hypothetical protein